MGWAVGWDSYWGRHIGYGVPATCDQPGCGAEIDRGLAYACGNGVVDTCGLFFCADHLQYAYAEDDEEELLLEEREVCDRCAFNAQTKENFWLPLYKPTPDTVEWLQHVLTDESWQDWGDDNPELVKQYKKDVKGRK